MPQGIGPELGSFIERCNEVEDVDHLKALVRTLLRSILPHQMAVCGIADLPAHRLVRLVNIDFPSDYLKRVIRPDQTIANPEFSSWLRNQSPSLMKMGQTETRANAARSDAASEHKIQNIAVYGVVDASATTFSFFAFGNLPASHFAGSVPVLQMTVPHLHVALVRALTRPYVQEMQDQASPRRRAVWLDYGGNRAAFGTTVRERQILRWISAGKTNREIAKLLRISEFTVKTHVKNLLTKLSVTSRSQAVAKAIAARILDGD
ncbi:MAG: response regulator transcription factor [Sulfurifustis sp.]